MNTLRVSEAKAGRLSAARSVFKHENAVLAMVLVAIIALFGVLSKGATLTRSNIANVWLQSSSRGLASIGQMFVVLSGGIDVSVGGLAALSACLGGGLMEESFKNIAGAPLSSPLGILIMVLVGVVVGTLNGALISRISMPALIVTLAMWQIMAGASLQVTGGSTFLHFPDTLAIIGRSYVGGFPIAAIIFLTLAGAAYFVLSRTGYGRSIYAVGGSPASAWLSGIPVKNVLLSVYIISGLLASLSGVILVSRAMSASVRTASGLELDSIAAVTIGGVSLSGGKGTLVGTVIGVLILGTISNGMNAMGLPRELQNVVSGVIILLAVAIDRIRRR